MRSSRSPIFARLLPQLDRIERDLASLEAFRAEIAALREGFASRWGVAVATASVVQNGYNGIEEILKSLAANLDGAVPEGDAWHRALLDQMSMPLEGVRPAAISSELYVLLDALRQFRHVARHRYGVELDPAKVDENLARLRQAFALFRNEFDRLDETLSHPG